MAEVRNAKANELNASAELKKAQATAQTVLANAQAELLKAQAEVEKAQATKIKAEADLVQVQADLLAVEVELAKVNVQSAKIALEEKKLELAAQEKALELLIAQCDAALETLALELENMKLELEAEKYDQMLALVQAEEAYKEYLEGLEAEDAADFQAAIAMYFHLQSAILEAQIQMNENEIEMAKLQAQDDANYDALVDQYYELLAEEERVEALVAQAQQYIDKAEEYLDYTGEELEAAQDQLNLMLIDAYNEAGALYAEYSAIRGKYTDIETDTWWGLYNSLFLDYYNNYTYRYSEFAHGHEMYDEKWGEVPFFEILEMTVGAYWDEVLVDEATDDWADVFGYDDPETEEFVVLFTAPRDNGQYAYYSPDEETLKVDDEKGIYPYVYGTWPGTHYEPGEINVEAINAIVDAYITARNEEVAERKAAAKELADEVKAQAEAVVAAFETVIPEYEAYVEAVGPKFEAAEKAVEEAEEVQGEKAEALGEAFAALGVAAIDDHEVEEVAKAFRDAFAAKQEADQAVVEAQDALVDAGAALADVEAAITAAHEGTDVNDAIYKRDLAIKAAKDAVTAAKAALTPEIEETYKTAKSTTATKEAAVETAQATVQEKLDALNAATALYAAGGITEEKFNEAKKAYEDACTALGTAKEERATAWEAYRLVGEEETGTAAEAYNEKKDAIDEKEAALELLEEEAAFEDEALADAKEAIELAEGVLEEAVAAQEDADEALAAAWEDFAAAMESQYGEQMAAVAEAFEAYGEANTAVEEAEDALEELEATYMKYYMYKAILFEGDEETGEEPSAFMQAYAAAKEAVETLEADYAEVGIPIAYEDYIEGLDSQLEEDLTLAENFRATVAKYQEVYRASFVEAVEAFNAKDEEAKEAYFEYYAADAYVDFLEALKDMLVECTFYNENGELVSVEDYIAGLQEYIDGLYEDLQELEDAFDEAYETYMYDYDPIYAISRLQLQNEQLEACIAIWEIELEKYEEIINEWLAQNAA